MTHLQKCIQCVRERERKKGIVYGEIKPELSTDEPAAGGVNPERWVIVINFRFTATTTAGVTKHETKKRGKVGVDLK